MTARTPGQAPGPADRTAGRGDAGAMPLWSRDPGRAEAAGASPGPRLAHQPLVVSVPCYPPSGRSFLTASGAASTTDGAG